MNPDEFAIQVNYLAAIGRMVVPRAFLFAERKVLFVGHGPFDPEDIAMLLPDNRAEPPERAVERVQKVIIDALQNGQWGVTLSVGAVTARGSEVSISEMTHAADTLMYQVKNKGKDAVSHQMLPTSGDSDRPAPVHQSDDIPSRA